MVGSRGAPDFSFELWPDQIQTIRHSNLAVEVYYHRLCHWSLNGSAAREKRVGQVESRGQVFFPGYRLFRFVFDWISSIYTYFHMIQIHKASATPYDRAEVVLNWKERGTIESENSSGYEKSEKQVGNNTKNPFLLKSIYNGWNREKQCIHTTP